MSLFIPVCTYGYLSVSVALTVCVCLCVCVSVCLPSCLSCCLRACQLPRSLCLGKSPELSETFKFRAEFTDGHKYQWTGSDKKLISVLNQTPVIISDSQRLMVQARNSDHALQFPSALCWGSLPHISNHLPPWKNPMGVFTGFSGFNLQMNEFLLKRLKTHKNTPKIDGTFGNPSHPKSKTPWIFPG